jgi:tRNA(Ile)-lysidine synthase
MLLAVASGCEVVAHHVNHGLRQDSDQDVKVVNEVARAVGAVVVTHRVHVAPGSNLEARARAARFDVLPAGAATGHTADDQAETVLLNLMRGAGTDGLAAMRLGPRHPILGLRRAETRGLCARLGIRPVEDPANEDPAFLRNRVRHELLPMLCELAQRDVVPILARQAGLLADDASLLDELAADLDPTDVRSLIQAPDPLARRALREWLRGTHPPDAATVDRVLSVAGGKFRATEVGSGRRVRRSKGRLRIESAGEAGVEPNDSAHPPCSRGAPG